MLTAEQFNQLFPRAQDPQGWVDSMNNVFPNYELDSPKRIAAFLAQCGHESGGWTVFEENLNYSAKGLMGIFKKYFPDEATATAYQRQPEKIANKVYANRMKNGDEQSGDGFKFRGRGLIQLTGRDNYTKFAEALDMNLEDTIKYLETPNGAVASAGWFWDNNKLNQYCDKDDFITLTKRINGGTIGLADRQHHYHLALEKLGSH